MEHLYPTALRRKQAAEKELNRQYPMGVIIVDSDANGLKPTKKVAMAVVQMLNNEEN